jgi:hypothetical protein
MRGDYQQQSGMFSYVSLEEQTKNKESAPLAPRNAWTLSRNRSK